ncbi:MAG: hypothetical protein ACOY3D_03810 [Candidatus Omnitrophota bacterium]
MGVIYKTKAEIRSYILEQKRVKPSLSCRELVPLIKERFGLALSKSTINALFKSANLSAPVGRKAKLKKEPPYDLKAALGPLLNQKGLPAPIAPALEIMPAEKKPAPQEIMPEIIEIKNDELVDGMGSFFLKAAQWELAKDSILGEILTKYLPQTPAQELNVNCETLMFLEAFNLGDWKDFEQYKDKGLWALNSSGIKKSPDDLLQFAKELKKLRGLPMAIFNEYYQRSLEIIFLKIFLEDGTHFYIDGQLRSLWQDNNVPASIFSTAYKTRLSAKNLFDDNRQPIILQTAPGYNAFSKILSEFILTCESTASKNITKIEMYNYKREVEYTLEPLPSGRRFFIMGFWPWQDEGMRFIREDIRRVEGLTLPELGKEIFYSENATFIKHPISGARYNLRIGLIRNTALGWPNLGVLTNLSKEEKPMQEIIAAYLKRWPNQEEGYQYLVKKTSGVGSRAFSPGEELKPERFGSQLEYILSISSADLHANLNSLILALNNFCLRCFFPPAYESVAFPTMRERFYLLPGFLEKNSNSFVITLKPPAKYPFLNDLAFAIRRLNESDIITPDDKKLFLKI